MLNHEELRALAEKATQGKYLTCSDPDRADGTWEIIAVPDRGNASSVCVGAKPHDARYIAAASPERVLALLDEIERLREALTTIARQKKTHELTDEDYERGCSFEEGYDDIITIARAALEGK